jgi:ABC-type branched-subunit amino acid transport system ATPase component/branched-subunit amino acid ABC-type transport system permease component
VQALVFLLLGLANGAVFASLALALVVTYRSSGVINFATGAIALFGAYEYAFLRQGQFFDPIPGLAVSPGIGGSWPFAAALLAALALCALLGLILYAAIFRPLRNAPPVARAVASIGVLIVITELIAKRLGTSAVTVSSIFPVRTYRLGKVHVSGDRIWFAATIVAVALIISAAFRFTRFGLHTRAAAESEKGALVSGVSPERIAALNWMISCAVAGLAGILIAPIVPLVPSAYTLFIIPALAAAILGRFQSMTAAVAGGLAIGMIQSETTYLQAQHSWLPSSGLPELVPLVLILLVLVVRAQPLPSRGTILQQTLGRAPRPGRTLPPAAGAAAVAAIVLALTHGSWRAAVVTSLISGIISLSLVVVTGYAGQVSLAQLTLAGVAGFILSPMTESWGVPFPIAPVLAAMAAMVVGVVVGLPALRIRGLLVAVVTLALAVTVQALWFENTDLVGASGKNISGPTLFGLNLEVGSGLAYPRMAFCLLVLAILVLVGVGVARLRTSRLGSAMLAVRANERSAAAAGIDVVRTKIAAFAIAAFIAGIGGSVLAYKQGNVTSDAFDVMLGLTVFATVYLAGITSVSGGLLAGVLGAGGIVYEVANRWLSLGGWYGVLTGVGFVLTVVRNPEGIVGPVHERLAARRRKAEEASVPARREPTLLEPTRRATGDGAGRVQAAAGRPLAVSNLKVTYGGMVAVDGVTFEVPEGLIVGLIGPNGAGKTTLVDAISGFVPSEGTVTLGDERLERMRPFERVRAGLGRTFQGIELWNDLSVRENVAVGLAATKDRSEDSRTDPVDRVLALLRLEDVADRPAGELSQGQRQLVSISRALIGRPSVLLLDEPAGGLDSTESQWLADRLRDIRDSGVTILLIDHDMSLVLGLCDQIVVLNFGAVIAHGTAAMVRGDPAVADAYLGALHADMAAGSA